MKNLLLIDANALVHRAFHALPALSTKENKPAGALYGLASIALKIFRDNPPEYAAAFFDRPEPTFRKKMFDEYKIHRPKTPDDLISQIIEAHKLFEAFGVKIFEKPGFEADDLIGTATKKFKSEPDLKITILTGDLDTLQLVDNEKIVAETLKRGISETIIYDETAVRQRFGIAPEQIPDYKGLVGDASDNIPGVKGIGSKTASEIISKYSSLENFFSELEDYGDKKYEKFREFKEDGLFSKKLAVLDLNAPLEIEKISEIAFGGMNNKQITEYFEKLGFQSLVKRINNFYPPEPKKNVSSEKKHDLSENSEKITEDIEKPLAPILEELENWGIKTDRKRLEQFKKNLDEELKILTQKIYEEADVVFNINSPKQLLEVLKQKGLKLTSTNQDKLQILKEKKLIIPLILKYRELFKLKTTYIEPLLELSKNPPTSFLKGGEREFDRIHPTFVQLKAATGRITCENPNLQNIPESVRHIFIAEKGFKLASFDYSQIELRILASLTEDKKMIDVFNRSEDIHQMTASQIFNVPANEITGAMRKIAKTLNFGIVYGMGARAFAKESGLDLNEAKKFIAEYFNDFPSIKKWQQKIVSEARQKGFVENLNGRTRKLPEIVSFNQRIQAEAERMAVNFPVQSLAADMIKLAMIKTKKILQEKNYWGTKAKMLLTIHDELIFEILDDDDLEKICAVIKETMESVYKLKVPLTVDFKAGNDWGEL